MACGKVQRFTIAGSLKVFAFLEPKNLSKDTGLWSPFMGSYPMGASARRCKLAQKEAEEKHCPCQLKGKHCPCWKDAIGGVQSGPAW